MQRGGRPGAAALCAQWFVHSNLCAWSDFLDHAADALFCVARHACTGIGDVAASAGRSLPTNRTVGRLDPYVISLVCLFVFKGQCPSAGGRF